VVHRPGDAAQAAAAVSRLADDLPEVTELDLSPVIAGPHGCSRWTRGSRWRPACRGILFFAGCADRPGAVPAA